ncbi:MAG: phage tail protein, partial [Pseudonocardiales bacterium]|nr:phage tail protein [Pseudonocardiales bacterium]
MTDLDPSEVATESVDDRLPAVRSAILPAPDGSESRPPSRTHGGVVRHTRSPHWLLDQLPVGLLDGDFFVRFVSLFQQLGESLLEDADNVEHVADLSVAPDAMVRWLGSWIGMPAIDPSLPVPLQRRIVSSSAQTLTWRGTKSGLTRFLALTTEGPAEVTDGGGIWREGDAPADTAWVRMNVESTGWLSEPDFVALVRDEIPAHL